MSAGNATRNSQVFLAIRQRFCSTPKDHHRPLHKCIRYHLLSVYVSIYVLQDVSYAFYVSFHLPPVVILKS